MRPEIEADGDRWIVSLGEREPHPGVRAIVFHCKSRDQRPYRVTEVPAERVASEDELARLSDEKLSELFGESDTMDVTHDPKADPDHVGAHPLPEEGDGS